MATYLSSYLSRPRGTSTMRPSAAHAPVIRPYNPYSPNQSRGVNPTPISAPYSGQDLAAMLLQTQQNRAATTPSSDFQDNYNYDPIQQKIAALGTQSVANAKTNSAQLRNQAAINEGDPDLLKSLGFDANTIEAARNNPQSLLAQLNNEYQNRQNQLRDSMQAQNLYYSGEYQKQLSNLGKGYATGQSDLGQKLRDLLSGADAGVLDATELDRQNQLQAATDAASQASFNDLFSQLVAQINGGDTTKDPNDDPNVLPPWNGANPLAPPVIPMQTADTSNLVWDPVTQQFRVASTFGSY